MRQEHWVRRLIALHPKCHFRAGGTPHLANQPASIAGCDAWTPGAFWSAS